MATIQATLEQIATDLEAVTGVETSKVGIEPGISPASYPIVRVVPLAIDKAGGNTFPQFDVRIYFGADTAVYSGMAAVYSALFAMHDEIISILENSGSGYTAVFRRTVTDEDRLKPYKILASTFRVFCGP